MTPGAYLKHCRLNAGLSLQAIAERLSTEPRLAEHARIELLRGIEEDLFTPTVENLAVLRMAYAFDADLYLAMQLTQIDAPALPDPIVNDLSTDWQP